VGTAIMIAAFAAGALFALAQIAAIEGSLVWELAAFVGVVLATAVAVRLGVRAVIQRFR
jgi:hypothetical protein